MIASNLHVDHVAMPAPASAYLLYVVLKWNLSTLLKCQDALAEKLEFVWINLYDRS